LPNLPSFGKTTNNIADFVSILRSRQLISNVITTLHIENHKELKEKENTTFQGVIEKFQKKVKVIPPTGKDSTLRIRARFKDAKTAENIVNKCFYELKKYLENTNYLTATRNRKFIENQLNRIKSELANTEVELLQFKKANETVSLPDEINEYIKYISDLEAQQLKSRLELKEISERIKVTNEKISGFNQEWQNIRKEMEINQAALKTRESILEEAKNKYFRLLNSLPGKALILARLEREVKVKTTLYLLFTQQFEVAKLEEARELEPFRILDPAYIDADPVFPKKAIIIAVAFLISLIGSVLLSFFIEYWKSLKVQYRVKSEGKEKSEAVKKAETLPSSE
jgi:tyrosine-protein kinase Etk/Wzc